MTTNRLLLDVTAVGLGLYALTGWTAAALIGFAALALLMILDPER